MQTVLLVEERMRPVPESITVVQNWGPVTVLYDSFNIVHGDHMLVEGDLEDLKDWMRPFDGVWVGKDLPAFQQFEVMHIGG